MSGAAAKATKTKRRGKPKGKAGRPPFEFDLTRVRDWGALGCTMQDMADLAGCNVATISRRMADEEGDFAKAYKSGFGELKESLRAAQVKLAKRGNATMLIWLGKQLLEQRDKFEHSGPEGGAIPVKVTDAEEAREALRALGVKA